MIRTEMPDLTVAMQRNDRTEALFRGDVAVEGRVISLVDPPVSEIFNQMLRVGAYAASEMSFAYGLMAHSRGTPSLTTLPVYLSRNFRHSSLFVRSDGSVRGPEDLVGRTFAVHDFFAADPLWIRGAFRDQHGVDPRRIRWLQYQFNDRIPLPQDHGYAIEYALGEDPTALLLSHRVDAAFVPSFPAPIRAGTGELRPLFDDPLATEQAYFRATGIFPLLHGFVMRSDVHAAAKGLAVDLYHALEESKRRWYQSLLHTPSALSGAPLFTSLMLNVTQTMGLDFWPYGVSKNRVALAKGIEYALEDRLIEKGFEPAEMFPPELRDT